MRTLEEIDNDIARVRKELENVRGTPCEVYARIVGYYRNVTNWNAGKKDEYDKRVTFDAEPFEELAPVIEESLTGHRHNVAVIEESIQKKEIA